jgi:hypothetical protein
MQRLWPQCQNCFKIQGNAVRQSLNIPIYHHRLCLFHFAPCLGYLIAQKYSNEVVFKKKFDFIVNPIFETINKFEKKFKTDLI